MLRAAACLLVALGMPLPGRAGSAHAFLVHEGMAGASAAVDVGQGRIAVANDEDNRIRIYKAETGGAPESETDVGRFLGVQGRNVEADIEGAARIGNRVYWIGSHGRSKDGKPRPNRQRFFCTEILAVDGAPPRLAPAGQACHTLLDQLALSREAQGLDLDRARGLPPNESGGLNIEALAAGPDGSLLIGFRSPIPGDKALVVPLRNPAEVVEGRPARFGAPLLLDLDGRGLRDMAWDGRQFILLGGGGGGENRKPRLYRWEGPGKVPTALAAKHLKDLNPESVTVYGEPGQESLLVCSDDASGSGGLLRNRTFRSLRIPLKDAH